MDAGPLQRPTCLVAASFSEYSEDRTPDASVLGWKRGWMGAACVFKRARSVGEMRVGVPSEDWEPSSLPYHTTLCNPIVGRRGLGVCCGQYVFGKEERGNLVLEKRVFIGKQ